MPSSAKIDRTRLPPSSDEVIYHLELEDNGVPSKAKQYIRLPPPFEPYTFRISIGAGTKASKGAVLFHNYPQDGKAFDRSCFQEMTLPQDFLKPLQIDLKITRSGAYEYFIEYEEESTNDERRIKASTGYFSVDPLLSIASRTPILGLDGMQDIGVGGMVKKAAEKVKMPLDGLVIQSVIAKWMGTLKNWEPHLDLMRDRGYNMIHFTPLQKRGESGSPYSIYDQLEYDDVLFDSHTHSQDKAAQMDSFLKRIKEEWGMLSMIDVVLNHTANNSKWLQDHPESGYNVSNSPHLEAALELDSALIEYSTSLEERGLPSSLKSASDLEAIMKVLREDILPSLRLYEYYVIDVDSAIKNFSNVWNSASSARRRQESVEPTLHSENIDSEFIQCCLAGSYHHLSHRYAPKINYQASLTFVAHLTSQQHGADSLSSAVKVFKGLLDAYNLPRYELYDDDIAAILKNVESRIRYTRLDQNGPKLGEVCLKSPLVEPLFTRLSPSLRSRMNDTKITALANNGWIWDADPLQDFASAESRTYLRRDLIVWGDCVKLRYGTKPEDNPWLWNHMTGYVEQLAASFDGFRLDNSHSTPIHVGEHMLDAARRVNPNLYVCAELFTGSQELDLHFVCKLGINSLIREAMNADNPKDQSSLLYAYGLGKPIGSMDVDCLSEKAILQTKQGEVICKSIPLQGSVPHAFLMDCTHDNESPLSKRTAVDALSTGALVTFAHSAIGSNRGFDDLYPKLLDLVSESRQYEVNNDLTLMGIGKVKRLLNHLHTEMALDEAVEGHFSQDGDYITAHRLNPVTRKGYLMVSRTAFQNHQDQCSVGNPIRLDGTELKFIMGSTLKIHSERSRDTLDTLRGLEADILDINDVSISTKIDQGVRFCEVVIPDHFPPGSILVFSTSMSDLPDDIAQFCSNSAESAFSELNMVDLNATLYRADGEEKDAVGGDGTYSIPGLGPLVYCGFEGWMAHLTGVIMRNDLGHPLCQHLRSGTWPFDYVTSRLEKQFQDLPNLRKPACWLKERFDIVKAKVPPFLRPKYFAMIINIAYKASRDRVLELCTSMVQNGTPFTHALALTSVQMYGKVRSASLDATRATPSLAAGLPHFTAGWARTWGRDVFISLRGLFLVTGQYQAAREHILAFCSVLKHGLIPNLLDSGRTPRYNSRDSPWFMLQNIQDYVNMAPDGLSILNEKVKRRFPLSDEWVAFDDSKAYQQVSTVADIIQEILQRHATGIHFREYNAGPNLDMQMMEGGFSIDIAVDWKTGIIYGGNEYNCGTWMDKMGESAKAGNKGLPGTPRDGAPIEITGLLKSAVRWVSGLNAEGHFKYSGVDMNDGLSTTFMPYEQWNQLILDSFERLYYIPEDKENDEDYLIDSSFVHRRGIYKDVVGSGAGRERADYQLRANFPIAMTVAPELFKPQHALNALRIYESVLVGPLGVRTLDPADVDYRGFYDNSNDSDDIHIAKGWNYHQGPEWVWPIGYFLRAILNFASCETGDRLPTYHHIYKILSRHREHIKNDPWKGLPELTNANGLECFDSCKTQAWSSSVLLDVLDDMSQN